MQDEIERLCAAIEKAQDAAQERAFRDYPKIPVCEVLEHARRYKLESVARLMVLYRETGDTEVRDEFSGLAPYSPN